MKGLSCHIPREFDQYLRVASLCKQIMLIRHISIKTRMLAKQCIIHDKEGKLQLNLRKSYKLSAKYDMTISANNAKVMAFLDQT